jgi:hypothetical protein
MQVNPRPPPPPTYNQLQPQAHRAQLLFPDFTTAIQQLLSQAGFPHSISIHQDRFLIFATTPDFGAITQLHGAVTVHNAGGYSRSMTEGSQDAGPILMTRVGQAFANTFLGPVQGQQGQGQSQGGVGRSSGGQGSQGRTRGADHVSDSEDENRCRRPCKKQRKR